MQLDTGWFEFDPVANTLIPTGESDLAAGAVQLSFCRRSSSHYADPITGGTFGIQIARSGEQFATSPNQNPRSVAEARG